MKPEVESVVKRSCAIGAAIAVVASPVPLADELALVPLYGWMAVRIGREHGLEPGAMPWRTIVGTTAKGLVARGVVNMATSFVPGVAAVTNAASVTAFTWWLGNFIDRACREPATTTIPALKELFSVLRSVLKAREDSVAAAPG